MNHTILCDNDQRKAVASSIVMNLPVDEPHDVIIRPHKKNRSLSQNRLSHMHYSQIASQMYEQPAETKARCKLDYGIPILIAEDEYFAEKWHKVTRHLTREELLEAVTIIPVTSLMNTKQMTSYINAYMQQHQAQGIALSHPDDLYYEAMGIKTQRSNK